MFEIQDAAKVITESIDREAKVIFGAVEDERLKKGEIKITVIATGFNPNGINNNNNLRLPLHREERQEQKKPGPGEKQSQPQLEESEWDAVPAFLRRKGK